MKYLIVTTTITQTQRVPYDAVHYGNVSIEDAVLAEKEMNLEEAIELLTLDHDAENTALSVLVDVFDDGKHNDVKDKTSDDTGE